MEQSHEPKETCLALARALAAATTVREASIALEPWRNVVETVSEAARHHSASGRKAEPSAVGVWQSTAIEGERWFVRDPTLNDADVLLWADVERIGPKRHAKRVVLLGESCARGYGLDPLFNCATALRACLDAAAGPGAIEVVDLAQCGISPGGLVRVLEASRALEPDAFIIFAGNNWTIHPRRLDLAGIASTLAERESWEAIAPYFDRLIAAHADECLGSLAAASGRAGLPALFVLPAENRQDVYLPRGLYNPLLGTAEQARREQLISAIDGLDDGDITRRQALAEELVELEGGFSVAGLQALSHCALQRGESAAAVRLIERAREMLSYVPVFGLHSYRARTDAMRAHAAREGLPLVDLPCWFEELAGGRPVGREYFIDLCHMSGRGIAAAMAATAERLLPLVGLTPVSRHDLLRVPIDFDPRAEAQAHFLAAQFAAPNDVRAARYHCQQAIACSPEIVDAMREYVELLTRPAPFVLSAPFHRFQQCEAQFPALRFLESWKRSIPADARLVRCLVDSIADHQPHTPRNGHTAGEWQAIGPGEIDMLPYADAEAALDAVPVHQRAFLKCHRRRTQFHVAAPMASRGPLRLSLTARAGAGTDARTEAMLLVNGTPVGTWFVRPEWSTVSCVAGSELMCEGPNVLTIVWPDPGVARADRARQVSRVFEELIMLDDRLPPDLFTVYGEIGAFTARVSSEASS
jgi:hypothetical protein